MREQGLAEQELLRFTDAASDVIGLFDLDGRVLFVNAPGSYIASFDAKQDPFRHVVPEDRERVRAEYAEIARTGEPRRLEFSVVGYDGKVHRIQSEATPVRDASGKIAAVLRIGRDVTDERKRVDEALREREELLEAIFDHAPIGISITDADARFVRVNRQFQEMLGYTEEELQRMTGWDLLHEDEVELNARMRGELWRGERPAYTLERRYVRKNGEVLWVQNAVSLIRDTAGRPRYAVALVEDITQRRLAHAAVQATAEKLQALTHRLVELQETERRDIARELHDRVGQTLTAMRINMDMIRTRLGERDDALIRERNDDSLDLIESAFKAVQNVMYDLRPPMIDEHGLVAALQWYAKKFADRTGIRVEFRGGKDWRCGPEVELALFRITQEALNNVTRHARAQSVVVEVRETPPTVTLNIEDDGVGLEREADRKGKAGYGLVTMRERAEALGGTFDARSEPGKGTRITVEIPRRPWPSAS